MALILVVDDFADARLLLGYLLEDAGFRIVFADSGEAALEMARTHAPDAIVMDLHLAGMSGIDAARRIRADPALARIPIVAHTLSKEPLAAADAALFQAFFTKPEFDTSMVDAIRRLLAPRTDT